jgi:hydroxymethylpyrimidine/phosphomethylpyrimidine kinase
MTPRVAMTIAGSDSGGGAGIEADLRTFAAYRVHGTVAITAVTAQSTVAVTAVAPLEAEMVLTQIETVLADIHVDAAKTGMLARPRTIEAVGALAASGGLPMLVVDPVLVSSTGHPLMEAGGAEAYRASLIPHAEVLTPNLREAAVLLGIDIAELDSVLAMAHAGQALVAMGAKHCIIKGGHLLAGGVTATRAPDVVVGPQGVVELDAARIETPNDHGTGCSLAAAIAAGLARGLHTMAAIETAKGFVHQAISGATGWELGHGHGPIDHLGWGDEGDTGPLP